MDNDKSQGLGSGGFHANFPHSWEAFGTTSEPSPSSSSSSQLPSAPPLLSHASGSHPDEDHFSHDLSRMTDNPPRDLGHRRAHSEILPTFPGDHSFDNALGVEDDLMSIYLDMDKLDPSAMSTLFQAGEHSASATGDPVAAEPISGFGMPARDASFEALAAAGPSHVIGNQHNQSMDDLTSFKHDMLMSGSDEGPSPTLRELKKTMSAAKLAELALVDPKRAKRILSNRQSATRSRERKIQYIDELERRVQALKLEAASLSAQVTMMQQDTNYMAAKNRELNRRIQTLEHHAHLQDAMNGALKEEIVHLKVLMGQAMPNGGGSVMNFPPYESGQQFYPNNQDLHTLLNGQQLQQLQIHSHTQQQQQQFRQHQHHLHQLQQEQQHLQQEQQQQQQQQHLQQEQHQHQQLRGSMHSAGQNAQNGANAPSFMKD